MSRKRSVILTDRLGPDIDDLASVNNEKTSFASCARDFPANQRRCASSSKNVAILSLWSKRAIIAPNNLIDSHHYKRHKKISMTEFHSPSLSILIITQSKVSFLIILNYSKMIPRLVESFRNLHLFHSNATKT